MAEKARARREKIEWKDNITAIVQIDRDPPEQPMAGTNYGTEYMYTCDSDARVLFASESLHAAILDANAEAGDVLAITRKRERGKTASWSVTRAGDATTENHQPVTARRPAPEAEPAAIHAPPVASPPAIRGIAEPADPFARLDAGRRAVPSPAPPAASQPAQPAVDQLAAALVSVVEAVAVAELRARERGLNIRFSAEDVRALACTVLIGLGQRRIS